MNTRFGATRILDGTRFCYEHPPYDRVVPLHLTCLYRRDAALKEGFYELNILSADFDSLYRLMLGHKIGFIDSVSGLWRQHGNNATHALSFEQLHDNYAMLERIYQRALDKGCFTREEAQALAATAISMSVTQCRETYGVWCLYTHHAISHGKIFV